MADRPRAISRNLRVPASPPSVFFWCSSLRSALPPAILFYMPPLPPLPSVREWSRQRAAFLRSPFLRIGDLVAAAPRLVFRSQTALELLSAPSEMPTDRLCTPFTAVQHEDDILGSVTTNLWICASEHVLWWCRDVSVGVNDGTDRLLPY